MALPSHKEIEVSLLKEILSAGGEARPRDIYPRMRKHFPCVTDVDLQARLRTGGSVWTNRIQWARQSLVLKGELYREPRGLWRLTPKGEARAKGESIAGDVGKVESKVHAKPAAPPAPLAVVSDPVDALCERLAKTQKQSSTPKNFEAALAEAFRFLGFVVHQQGKAGETDVLLDTYVGGDSYRVVVDAKATHGDKVGDNQINWLAINQHQQQADAQHAAVVGIGFRGGNLLKWSNQYQVALIQTADLVEIIRMHHRAPFSLLDLRTLFATPGSVQQAMSDLKTVHQGTMRHWQLLLDIVELIDNYNRFNRSGLVATPGSIQLMLYMKIANSSLGEVDPSRVPSTDDVRDAMTFLASRGVGVLREAPAGTGSFHLTMHYEGAVQRIAALADELRDSGPEAPRTLTVSQPEKA